MDFNPLDLLAAAALSDKESTSESKGSNSQGASVKSQQVNSENSESKEDADDNSNTMGKTKSNSLKHPVKVNDLKIVNEMSPQKISWSPESFLSCLDKPSLEHEKLIIEQLSPTFLKDIVKCSKLHENKDENEIYDKESEEEKEVNVTKDVDAQNELNNKVSHKDVKVEDISSVQGNSPSLDSMNVDSDEFSDFKAIKKEDNCPVKDEPFSDIKEEQDTTLSKDIKVEESCESGGQSDTDTAETSDSKTNDELSEMSCQELVSLDHPYCLIPGQLLRMPSSDMLDEDIDVCSDSSPLTEDSEQRSRNFSLDCNYLKSGILEGKSIGTPQLLQDNEQSRISCKLNSSSPHKSPSHFNAESTTLRLSQNGDSSAFKQVSVLSPERPGPSYGKFKIGTFASFSSSNLELEKYLRGLDSPPNKKLDIDNDRSSKILHSPIYSPSVQPLLQSPTLDWDRSEAGSETHDDSSDARTPHRLSPDFTTERVGEWSHPMYHDHDYCAKAQQKPVPDDIVKLPLTKRKYTKRKNKLDAINHEKIMKAKYLKKELLKDSFPRSTPSPLPQEPPVSSVTDPTKTNPVGRPRKRALEKSVEEEIDPETGAKMKITGKFQDQYVYYLSKSKTTSRRRQTPTLPLHSDKIIVPAPKPGDIIVPHLTDADIEVVRTKGRSALNIPERPHMPSVSSSAFVSPKSSVPSSLPISQSNEPFSDVDSHIVSTILSMENDNLASPSSSQSQDLSQNSDIYNGHSSITNDPNITSEEQVLNYLLSVVKEEEPSLLQSSSSLFPSLPPDPLYSKPTHLVDTELGTHHNKMEGIHSDILSSHSPLENHSFVNSVIKSEVEESVSLPEDFSSLISHSQVTTVSLGSQDLIDSQSSLKSEFSSDLSSLGAPALTPSGLRLTSIEKTLDYLKDGDMKLDNTKVPSTEISANIGVPNSSIAADDDTPWIVTVTLYFNDVPAIMIVNEPYIRLVDIHKQILPAKDTGILKKRCQLLNIPVLNCTEMHRYFLVQYGKAYNSKSTLIISKNQATELVKYYATPQPRLGRSEESHVRRNSCGVSNDGSIMSPVATETLSSVPAKKRGCNNKNSKKGATISEIALPEVGVAGGVKSIGLVSDHQTGGLNKRTRHKKVNYLEMLKGEEKEKSSDDSILQTIESVLKSSSDHTTVHNPKTTKDKYSVNSKSRSKKNKLGKSHSLNKGNKEKSNHKRNPVESKKKVKVSGKLLKSSKTKGSISSSKHGKKQEKLAKKNVEQCSDIDTLCVEEHLNKSNKFKPLKLKVNSLLNFSSQRRQSSTPSSASSSSLPSKKGLFSRSNSTSSAHAEQRPIRVLAVAHQAALSNEEGDSHLPSQPADIHLDLFTKSSSACVRCHTCSQFLSVPHFMKHHHVPMDNEWLATEAAHRILVPRNKENISEEERRLWEEFHSLQEAIGGFGEADDDSDSDGDSDADSDFEGNDEQSCLETSGASSYLSMDTSHSMDISYESQMAASHSSSHHISRTDNSGDNNHNCQHNAKSHSHVTSTISTSHQNIANTSDGTTKGSELILKSQQHPVSSLPSDSDSLNHSHDSTSSNVRTSSRRRKSKQLFSIENYCTSPTKKGADEDGVQLHSSVS